jgi:hypothetical protein
MPVDLTQGDLGRPAVLCFRATADPGRLAADVQGMAALWGKPVGNSRVGRDDWLLAWRNIRILASRLPDAHERCDPETFHHLLLAVGNFKRQAGDIHLPVELAGYVAERQPGWLVLPGDLGRLDRDVPATWKRLEERVPGLGIPTTTCLLAALWPAHHAIMDVYDRRAAVALQIGRRSQNDRRLDTARIPSHEWWFYDWFRQTLICTADTVGCEPVLVERALYVVGAATAGELGVNWEQDGTWSQHYRAALGQVEQLL